MSHVASDPKIHASSHHMPRVARPAQLDRAPSPFESLLEDTSQPPEPASPPPESKVSAKDDPQAPARSNDRRPAGPTDETKPAEPYEISGASDTPPDEKKMTAVGSKEAASTQPVADTDDSVQSQGNQEQIAVDNAGDANAVPPPDSVATVTNLDAIAVAPAQAQAPVTVTEDSVPVEQPLQQAELMAESNSQTRQSGPDVPRTAPQAKKIEDGKQADTADLVDTDQPASQTEDTVQVLTKDIPSQRPENKPVPGEGNRQHASQAHEDIIANPHRPDPTSGHAPPGIEISAAARALNDSRAQNPIPSTVPHASEHAAAPATLVSQPGPQPATVPLSGVAIEIAAKAIAGKNRFEIRLDPPELGRIDVRLDVDHDGNVTSRLTVDRPDTLDLLRRDSSGLERALQDAGLKTANNGLQFSLRDQSLTDQQPGPTPDSALVVADDEILPSTDAMPVRYGRLAGQGAGLDIRV